MPKKRNRHFCEVALASLLVVLIICASAENSNQSVSRQGNEECLRKCLVRSESSLKKVSRLFSCYHKCLNEIKQGRHRQALSKTIFQRRRTREALAPNTNCPDSSRNQTVDWNPKEVDVTFGQYETTSHWYVNVSWTALNDTNGSWTGILVYLAVLPEGHFRIAHVNCSVLPKNQTFLRVNISLYYFYSSTQSILVDIRALPYSPKYDISKTLPPFKPDNSIQSSTTTKPATTKPTAGCSFENGDLTWYPAKVFVDFIPDSNKSWYVNISWTPLTDPSVTWKGYLISFYFGDFYPSPHGDVIPTKCVTLPKNQTFITMNSSNGWEYPNSVSLNVTAYPVRGYETAEMRTFYPVPPTRPQLPDPMTWPSPKPPRSLDYKTVFLSVGGCLVLLIVALILWRRYKKPSPNLRQDTCTARRFKYHAFIIYSMFDSDTVNTLIAALESYGLKCCVHWRDFLPGRVFAESIVESVYSSFKIIAVVSSHFMQSATCDYELQQAVTRLMNKRDDCLIVVILDNEGVGNLPATILNRSYIDFTNPTDTSTWETRLVNILSKAVIEDNNGSGTNANNNNRISESSSTEDEGRNLISSL